MAMSHRRKEHKKKKSDKQGNAPPLGPTAEAGRQGARERGRQVINSLLTAVVRGATQGLFDDLNNHHHW